MYTFILISIFVFGTIVGSFLNVVIDRHGTGQGLGGRSYCDITGKTLKWYELIPIFSWIVQHGKSRNSGSKISVQYPLVEFFTGVSFVALVIKFFPALNISPQVFLSNFIFYLIVFSLLIAIFVYDWKHKIIPDNFVYLLITLSIFGIFFICPLSGLHFRNPTFLTLVAGPVVASPLLFLWLISKGKWMGFGDVKLVLPFGWLLGISQGFIALLLAFWGGAIFGVIYMLIKGKNLKTEIPFGPFLILGFVIVFLYNINTLEFVNFFSNLI